MKSLIKYFQEKMNSDKGGIFLIAIAVILAFVSFLSSFSLIFSVQSDYTDFLNYQDIFQEELLLRSENMRTTMIASEGSTDIIDNEIEIESGNAHTTYHIDNEGVLEYQNTFMGYTMDKALRIKSLITGKRGGGHLMFNSPSISIKRYCERLLKNESWARWQYLTNIEASENEDGGEEAARVKFYFRDHLTGRVFSNDDIWIQVISDQFPTFDDFVATGGIFRYYGSLGDPSNGDPLEDHYSLDEVFPNGWAQHADHIYFDNSATLVRNNGERPFDGLDGDIVRVKIIGSSYISKVGKITLREIKDFPVMSWFPKNAQEANAAVNSGYNWFTEEDTIWINHIPLYDTTWVDGPSGNLYNGSIFIDGMKLWIDGEVSGKQTWACSDTIYIVGDITYTGTIPGSEPDQNGNINQNDYFGLISEERIYIKYKFRDPLDNLNIHDETCHDVYLYGAYAALGQGDKSLYGEHACHYDGVFTFEYQHPHGSTPGYVAKSPFTGQDSVYQYIDLQKFIFPKNNYVPPNILGFNMHGNEPRINGMCGYPYEDPSYAPPNHPPYTAYNYPDGTDYPWYNPVWPESSDNIIGLRGTLYQFGAIHQYRRGFIHRSGGDPYNHPGNNEWNFENFTYHYDGEHPETGYAKSYHYDRRFLFVTPPDYPKVYKGLGEAAFSSLEQYAWFFKQVPRNK